MVGRMKGSRKTAHEDVQCGQCRPPALAGIGNDAASCPSRLVWWGQFFRSRSACPRDGVANAGFYGNRGVPVVAEPLCTAKILESHCLQTMMAERGSSMLRSGMCGSM